MAERFLRSKGNTALTAASLAVATFITPAANATEPAPPSTAYEQTGTGSIDIDIPPFFSANIIDSENYNIQFCLPVGRSAIRECMGWAGNTISNNPAIDLSNKPGIIYMESLRE